MIQRIRLGFISGLFVLLASLFSCQTAGDISEKEHSNVLTALLKLENTDSLPFPIVDNFDNLAPLFNQKNDTTYVINFWATWCAPCVHEFPYFQRLSKEMKDEAVEIVMISLDFDKQIRTKLPQFIREHEVTIPVVSLVDPNPHIWIDRVDPQWEGSIPITIIYRNGKRHFITEEVASYEELKKLVEGVN